MNRTEDIEYFIKKLGTIPKYPRMNTPYRVHWNWDISYRCNYNCSYCLVMKRDEEFKYEYFDVGLWKDIFERIFELYWSTHFRFSGGEPTIYPGFLSFLGTLLEKNTADITTNLSFDLAEFLDKVPPGRGLSVSSSFHPEYDEFLPFLKKAAYLHRNGYPATICYVGYPPHLDRISEYKKIAEEEKVNFKIIPFSGEYKGKFYPDSYTEEEKKLLKKLASDSENEKLNSLNNLWYEHKINRESPEPEEKTGMNCQMGQMYAIIHPDFEVTRCCAGYHGRDSGVLGNITDPDFRLLDSPAPCIVEYKCACYKAMLTGFREERWAEHWEALEHPVYKTENMKEYSDWLKEHEVQK